MALYALRIFPKISDTKHIFAFWFWQGFVYAFMLKEKKPLPYKV